MKTHPAAKAFPLMQGDDFLELVADIGENGLLHPVVFQGDTLIDGRNRIRACEELGLDYDAVEWEGEGDPTHYIISTNLKRRHLTASQRAMIAADLLPQFKKQAKERQQAGGGSGPSGREKVPEPTRARDEAAEAVGVNSRYVDHAARLKQEAPELAKAVRSGAVTIGPAIRQLDGPKTKDSVRQDPGVRWAEAVRRAHQLVCSVRDAGGITKTVRSWSQTGRRHYLSELRGFVKEINSWIKVLEE